MFLERGNNQFDKDMKAIDSTEICVVDAPLGIILNKRTLLKESKEIYYHD